MDLYSLTAKQFEDMCFLYTCKLYSQYENYKLVHTQFTHDGGKDIEIEFYDQMNYYKIWAECKRHKENIGLDEIGKNVVLVISKHINKLIFFSVSDITNSARIHVSEVGEKFGFSISYLYGENLKAAFCQYPDLVAAFFPDENDNISASIEKLTVNFSVSELEQDIIIPVDTTKPIILRDGRMINIYVQIKNWTKHLYENISVQLAWNAEDILFEENSKYLENILPQTDRLILLRGQIVNLQKSHISLPDIIITMKKAGETNSETYSYSLPVLDTSKCKKYPLIGKDINIFMSTIKDAIQWVDLGNPLFYDIRGNSGVGKTRLATEIANKFLLSGYEKHQFNCLEYDGYNLIRCLLSELLNLPFYKGQIHYTKESIIALIEKAGGSTDFQNIVSDFLINNQVSDSNIYYLVDAIIYYLRHPAYNQKIVLILDNVQALDSKLLEFFTQVINGLTNCSGKLVMILVTNTERISALNYEKLSRFLIFLEEKRKSYKNTFSAPECKPLTNDDATLFLMHLFAIQESKSPIIIEFLKKSGHTAFEIIQFIEYLNDHDIIEWLDNKVWHIKKEDEYLDFLQGCPSFYKSIVKERIKYLRARYSAGFYKLFKNIISYILCFQGKIPHYYVSYLDIDEDMREIMKDSLWIVDIGENISFFHDNIYHYFKEESLFRENAPILEHTLTVIDSVITDTLSENRKKFIKFYCLYYLRRSQEAIPIGFSLMTSCNNTEDRKCALETASIILKDEAIRKNEVMYIKAQIAYADIIFGADNKDKGCAIYAEQLPMIMKHLNEFEVQYVFNYLHKTANAQLQLAYYKEALNTLKHLEEQAYITPKYKFIAQNRYGVIYTCIGNFENSYKYLTESLQTARHMNSSFWESTSYSDMALLYFYNYNIQNHAERSQYVKNSLQQALSLYTENTSTPAYRIIEMEWHKAIVAIIEEKYDEALYFSECCIQKSKEKNQLYGQVRGYNLKALAYLFKNNFPEMSGTLLECLHICEIRQFSSGIFRMHNNLGVRYALDKEYKAAKKHFDYAINSLGIERIDTKQFPSILNAALTGYLLKDDSYTIQLDNLCNQINSKDLLEFKSSVKRAVICNETPINMAFWTFNGFGYIF